nr:YisL family protein [uncultured Bacillus sp.]
MLHAHITTWALALILFIIAVILNKQEKQRSLKLVQMILRLFYLLIIITGAIMLFSMNVNVTYMIKGALGIVVIGLYEMILSRSVKKQSTGMFWGLLVVSFAAVLYLGYSLPGLAL